MPNPHFSKNYQQTIKERAKFRCEYCQMLDKYVDAFVKEHIHPQCLGGFSALNNMANSCTACNGFKYNKIEDFDEIKYLDINNGKRYFL
ncbi:MAG: 5-methylcytosine-specific restriction endonuclease McrA [Paraglaciecola sp.]|jgi:5-methylcytosine-specific restriction endonuclease McrA